MSKKKFTLEELDEATLKAESRGRTFGLMSAHTRLFVATTDIKAGLEMMQLIIEASDPSSPRIDELQTAIDAITVLENRLQEEYDNMILDCSEDDIDDAYWELKD